LQIPQPYWLDEAYESESQPTLCHADSGRFMRNFSAYRYVVALHKAGMFADHPLFLDFGGGYGVLTEMFRGANYEAYQSDPYVQTPFFASDRCIQDFSAIPDTTFDMVSALEVLEHLSDPHEVLARLRRILKPDGTLIFSTGIYQPDVHQPDWVYLWREGGQHITFWSSSAILYCAGRYGFRSVGYFPSPEGFLILLSHLAPEILRGTLSRAAGLLQDERHFWQAVGAWDLMSHGLVRMPSEPIVQETPGHQTVPGIAA
jgi:SAM-dependent methyltransferase